MEWLAGNRLRGTTAERPALGLPSGSVGGWVELGRTTLGSAGDSISVGSLSDKRYYMFLADTTRSSNQFDVSLQLNSDTGSNYADRRSSNGGADGAGASRASMRIDIGAQTGYDKFSVGYLTNLSSKEKLMIAHNVNANNLTASAAVAPTRTESVGKWANTSNVINELDIINAGSGSYASGDELVVLGWDPADTHTTNFWEELASVELGSAGDNLGSGTISARKYLWIQVFLKASGTYNTRFRFNSDAGSNYAVRWSDNGTAESINTSDPAFYPIVDGATTNITTNSFMNMFIVNNASNEKLIMWNGIVQNTAGATSAPARVEGVAKWANTSSQITDIDIDNGQTGDYDTGSIIKVWGSD